LQSGNSNWHSLDPLFEELQYELWIESIGSQEHTVLKIGQKCLLMVSEKGDFTGKVAIVKGLF